MDKILRRGALLALIAATAAPAQDKRLLFVTHSQGYVHDVVQRPKDGGLALAERELTAFMKDGYTVTCTQDCAALAPDKLAGVDVVVFYTTGELPAPASAKALSDWVRAGGAFVGIHCATDTWYREPAYGALVGACFDGHPWHENVSIRVEQPGAPGVAHLGAAFEINDEIYQFTDRAAEPLCVLLSLDLASVDATKGKRARGDYALAWCREYGAGRVFYTALGHRDSVWKDERFRVHVREGIRWAATKGPWSHPRPAGAKVLLGNDAAFVHRDGTKGRLKLAEGALEVAPGTGDVVSVERFGDCRLHVEFRVPAHPASDTGQARGNSGIYLQDRYEIQVLDSHGLVSKKDDCGAIYGKHAPATNACRQAGEWQSYDVAFTAARFDEHGRKTASARATVWQNGVRIHDDVEIDGPTGGGEAEAPDPGPLRLQDHGNLVAYRNVWVVPR